MISLVPLILHESCSGIVVCGLQLTADGDQHTTMRTLATIHE